MCSLGAALRHTLHQDLHADWYVETSAIFQNNAHMGVFVCRLAKHISDERTRLPALDKLYALNSDGNSVIFLDLGVYTKNRSVMILCSVLFFCGNVSGAEHALVLLVIGVHTW